MGSGADWSDVISALSDAVFCVSVDLPGHGESLDLPPHAYTMEGASQGLAHLLDALEIDTCTLVGYSMGGRVGLFFHLIHPTRVERLVLESASPGIEASGDRAERRRVDDERAARIESDLHAFLTSWYRMPLFASLDRHGLIDEMVATRRQNDAQELARALRGLSPGRQPSLWKHLAGVPDPTLWLTGALDEKYISLTKRAAAAAPHIERRVVPGAGHNVHAERPRAFLEHLEAFLDRS